MATLEHATEHTHGGHAESWRLDPALWSRVRNMIVFAMLVGWLGAIAGYVTDHDRFFQSYLTAFVDATVIPLGCLFFLMVMFLTGSAWSVTMRRIFETIAASIPMALLLVIPVLLGIHGLYHWSHADAVAHDRLLQGKAPWLNDQAFMIRSIIYVIIWSLFALRIHSNSTKQDSTKSTKYMDSSSAWSAPGLLLVFLSVSAAAFDWVMSLNPHWYSTIFGIYIFAGGGWACMATVNLILQIFRKNGILTKSVNVEHYHDLGKWMFALTVFWTYIAFSQYLLIWYANLAEETVFYQARFAGSWKWMSLALLLGHFVIPFFTLVSRKAKRNLGVLLFMSVWILCFAYLDIYWLVMPNFYKDGPVFSWQDLTCSIAVVSTYAFLFWWRLGKHSLVPEGDLRLEQSLAHVNI
jgi:hypothetical protein